jgi:predicted nucleotidyltransferase
MSRTNIKSLIPIETIERAVATLLADAPPGSQVILFGSYARGDANADSDVDFLVVEPTLKSRRAEMVRLRMSLRPLGIPAEVLVVSRPAFDAWKLLPNNVIYEAHREGKVYDHAA